MTYLLSIPCPVYLRFLCLYFCVPMPCLLCLLHSLLYLCFCISTSCPLMFFLFILLYDYVIVFLVVYLIIFMLKVTTKGIYVEYRANKSVSIMSATITSPVFSLSKVITLKAFTEYRNLMLRIPNLTIGSYIITDNVLII